MTGLAPVTGAQEAEISARLALVAIPVAHAPDDDLGVRLRITNTGDRPIDGFRLTVGAGGIIRSRSELEASFQGAESFFAFSIDHQEKIPPGGRTTIRIDAPVADLTGFSTESGIHPLSLSLFSSENTLAPLDSIRTQLMVYPQRPQEPLNLVPVLPLNEIPARAPDGTYPADDTGGNWLEAAVSEQGWLRGLVAAVEETTAGAGAGDRDGGDRGDRPADPLRLGLAPTPRLLDELAGMSDGFVRVAEGEPEEFDEDSPEAEAAADLLAQMGEIAGREGVQPVLVPYSYPDLPTLEDELSPGDVGVQLTEGITMWEEALDESVGRSWVLPPAGRLDSASLQALQTAGVEGGAFFTADSLEASDDPAGVGCPIAILSFVCPIRIATGVGPPLDGYATDSSLQARLSEMVEGGGGRLEIQRVLAETAMVHAEQPGTPGRIIPLIVPTGWHPRPAAASAFFTGLRDAPWLRTVRPDEGLERADSPKLREVVDDAVTLPEQPASDYFQDIARTQDVVESFSTFIGERGPRALLQRLRRNTLVAQGRTLWEAGAVSAAAAYALESHEEASSEMNKISLGVPSQTTFTSRSGSLDISVFNEADYPVEAKVLLRALDMEFQPSSFDEVFPPGTRRLTIEAEAQTSGTFPIEVRIETPDGYQIASDAVQVQSTEFNIVALAITFGAVVFLILFYTVKVMRRRRAREDLAGAAGS